MHINKYLVTRQKRVIDMTSCDRSNSKTRKWWKNISTVQFVTRKEIVSTNREDKKEKKKAWMTERRMFWESDIFLFNFCTSVCAKNIQAYKLCNGWKIYKVFSILMVKKRQIFDNIFKLYNNVMLKALKKCIFLVVSLTRTLFLYWLQSDIMLIHK